MTNSQLGVYLHCNRLALRGKRYTFLCVLRGGGEGRGVGGKNGVLLLRHGKGGVSDRNSSFKILYNTNMHKVNISCISLYIPERHCVTGNL